MSPVEEAINQNAVGGSRGSSMLSYVVGLGEVVNVPRPSVVVDLLNEKRESLPPEEEAKARIVYVPSADQVELRQIRMRLKMTKQVFANALNMKQCTLDSYEYGKTKGVPPDLMARARELQEKQGGDAMQKIEALEGQAMSAILDDWAAKLKVPVNNASVLGKLLDATPTTIRRWRDNKVRPDVAKLAMLSAIVERGPEGAKKAIAKNAVKKLKLDAGSANGESFIPLDGYQECVEKLTEAFRESEAGMALLEEFKMAVDMCHKTEDRKAFIQMNTFSFHRFIKRLSSELSSNEANGGEAENV